MSVVSFTSIFVTVVQSLHTNSMKLNLRDYLVLLFLQAAHIKPDKSAYNSLSLLLLSLVTPVMEKFSSFLSKAYHCNC